MVTNTNDRGEGSLRQALADVRYGGEILFNLAYPAEMVLDSQLVIDRDVSITGSKAGDLIVSGNNNNRVILIENLNENENLKVNISNLTISNGYASGLLADGGGIYCNSSNLSLQDIDIIGNSSTNAGGGIYCQDSDAYFINVMITDNNSTEYGGGIYYNNSFVTVTRAVIAKNKSVRGGGIYCQESDVYLTNVTITDNSSTEYGGGICRDDISLLQIMNSILWNNSPDSNNQECGFIDGLYSNIQGGLVEEGNIDADPLFADTIHFYLSENSPCIDAGDPDTDFNDWEDINNPGFALWPAFGTLRNDMGAYGGHGEHIYITGIKEDEIGDTQFPTQYRLSQNYPNPFNPKTNIEFQIPKSELVTLKIYNILGEEVATLVSERLTAGSFSYEWDASRSAGMASGVYLCRLQAAGFVETRKMILMR
jgi:predicted outer membrane repeat protein